MPMMQSKYSKTKQYDEPLFVNPVRTQEVFSVKDIDETGIFILNQKRYSKTFVLSDINFAGVTDAEQKNIIINYSRVLNSISCRFSISVASEYVDPEVFNNRILYKLRGDKKDRLRTAYNEVISSSITDKKQGLYQYIYLTLTIESENIKEARATFASLEATLRSAFIQIGINGMAGAQLAPLGINERMQKWFDFTHSGLNSSYSFDFRRNLAMRKDWINDVAPEKIEFFNDYFVINDCRYGKVMYVSNFPKSLESSIMSELSKMNCTYYITLNSEPLDKAGLKQEIGRKHASVGMKIENEKQRNRNNNDFLSDASDKLLNEKEALISYARQVEEGDDHYFNTTMLIMYLTDSEKNMNDIKDKILSVAATKSLEIAPCFDMQREAMNSAFIFGIQEYKRVCNFSAPCLAMFIPFKTQELNDENGIFCGLNQLSQNAILANRKLSALFHKLFLGMTRKGKSVCAKSEIISIAVNEPDDQIIIIDPQNEYKDIAYTPGIDGTVISFDKKKELYVNPLDVNFEGVDYATLQEIISSKTDFIITLLSSCMRRELDSEEQGVLDEVIQAVYSENYAMRKKLNGEGVDVTEYSVPNYMKTKGNDTVIKTDLSTDEQVRCYSPMLQDIYQKLIDKHNNPVAQKLAAHMMIFVNGSLNLFNHRTNVDLNKNFLVFELSGIPKNLLITSMLVMIEVVRNKIAEIFATGNWTNVFIDEFHELLGNPMVADFVIKLWKEVGKLHCLLNGITQNMSDLISKSADAEKLTAIISNTQCFTLLCQSTIDRKKLMEFLPSVSPAMFNYVEGADRGTGLLIMGNTTIPFDMRMSKECELFKLVNSDGENNRQAAI